MPGMDAVNAAAAGGATLPPDEADLLLAGATQAGQLDTHALASEISKLPANEQGSALKAVDHRLSPQQQGEVRRGLDQIKDDAANLPKQYTRGADGKLKLTPEAAKTACENYHAVIESNTKVGEWTGMPFVAGSAGAVLSKPLDTALGSLAGKALGVMSGIAGLTTYALGKAPPPPGCPK